MRKGKIKNSIVTIAMAMMLSVTAVVGFGTNAKAAAGNTGNKQYSYSNIDPIGSCEWRTKNNATKFMYIQLQDLRYIMRLMEEKRTALQVSMKNLQGHIPMQFQQEHREALQIG